MMGVVTRNLPPKRLIKYGPITDHVHPGYVLCAKGKDELHFQSNLTYHTIGSNLCISRGDGR